MDILDNKSLFFLKSDLLL